MILFSQMHAGELSELLEQAGQHLGATCSIAIDDV